VEKMGSFRNVPAGRVIAVGKGGEILVALKRNDEYALAHQSRARLTGFRAN
jgi:hypothetical protein